MLEKYVYYFNFILLIVILNKYMPFVLIKMTTGHIEQSG